MKINKIKNKYKNKMINCLSKMLILRAKNNKLQKCRNKLYKLLQIEMMKKINSLIFNKNFNIKIYIKIINNK